MDESKSRVVVVTGASAGVGRAIVRELARPGVSLGLVARGREGLEATRREAEEAGARVSVHAVDVADHKAVEMAAEHIEKNFGPIDVWVNNAMVTVFSPVHMMEPEDYKRVTEVTYLGYVYGTLAALKSMRRKGRGVILQVGSALAYRSIPLQSAYCAAKHAIIGFTESLRTELLHENSGISVVNVHLPAVNTPQFRWVKSKLPRKAQPVPPIFQPEVIARHIAWAIDNPKREYWLGFSAIKAIVGDKIAPNLADHYLARTGYDSQQTDEPEDADRPHNLWTPLHGDYGAHGEFDSQAISFSWQAWVSRNRRWLSVGLFSMASALVATYVKNNQQPKLLPYGG